MHKVITASWSAIVFNTASAHGNVCSWESEQRKDEVLLHSLANEWGGTSCQLWCSRTGLPEQVDSLELKPDVI